MKIFITNTTQQIHTFFYRIKGQQKSQPINPNCEIAIEDASLAEIETIVKEHTKYGMLWFDDIDKTQPHIGLHYRFDKSNVQIRFAKIKHKITSFWFEHWKFLVGSLITIIFGVLTLIYKK